MQYKIVSGEEFHVQKRVNEMLVEGWELHGGVSVAHGGERHEKNTIGVNVWIIYAQAMVRKRLSD